VRPARLFQGKRLSAANQYPHAVAVLRVLSGPLQGAEYALHRGRTLLITADDAAISGGSVPDVPEHSLLLPAVDGINIELTIHADNDGNSDRITLRELDGISSERLCAYQEVQYVGGLVFALRRPDEAWLAGVIARGDTRERPSTARSYRWAWSVGAVLCLILLAAVGVKYFMEDDEQVIEIVQIVAGGRSPYRVIEGSDGRLHVFAQTERDASWARQSLVRHGRAGDARVAIQRDEERRLGNLLAEHFPRIRHHRVRLDDPRKPVLMISLERTELSEQAARDIKASLMRWMPYAGSVAIDSWSDRVIDRRARQGLERIGIPYERTEDGSVTYLMRGNLGDGQLAALREFMAGFQRRYGNTYVHFSVELGEDRLKGKSYGYGLHQFVKQGPGHWQFL